jgi:curved DNA-binding protein
MEYKDYYAIMGLKRDASADDIRKAYRRLARKYHPDVSKEADAEARFKDVGEAYEVLKDAEKRAAYDQLGSDWQAGQDFQPPPGQARHTRQPRQPHGAAAGPGFDAHSFGDGDEDYSDFFETLFRNRAEGGGRAGSAGGARREGFHAHGQDQHASIQIDLEDAYHGGKRSLSLRFPQRNADGSVSSTERVIEFTIPKGVRAGQNIRLAGQGAPGIGDGKPGDLYLEVEFRTHARYRVEVRDVYLDLPVAPWEAALGAQVEVRLPTGSVVEVTVPPASSAGRKLRLKGRGIPATSATSTAAEAGDFYLVLQVALPPADSDVARAAYAQMASQFADFRPRAKLEEAL